MATESELFDALAVRYCAPEYALIPQATQGTGWKATRWLDAVAVSLWPSRGITFHGFEIKSARYDWLRELRNPEKGEGLFPHLDFFSVVVADAKVVADGELPPQWGLVIWDAEKNSLVTKVQAPRLHEGDLPRSMDRNFLAGLCRRIDEQFVGRKVARAVSDAIQKAEKDTEFRIRQKLCGTNRAEHDALTLAAFIEGAGYSGRVREDEAKRFGQLAARLQDVTGKHGNVTDLRRLLKSLDKTMKEIDGLLQPVDEPEGQEMALAAAPPSRAQED